MNNVILSDSEARRLLEMIKVSLKSAIDFPSMVKKLNSRLKATHPKIYLL